MVGHLNISQQSSRDKLMDNKRSILLLLLNLSKREFSKGPSILLRPKKVYNRSAIATLIIIIQE